MGWESCYDNDDDDADDDDADDDDGYFMDLFKSGLEPGDWPTNTSSDDHPGNTFRHRRGLL